jgi:hypothetical protein
VWLADHDLDDQVTNLQVSLFSGRGILSESAGPVWMIGTGMLDSLAQSFFGINVIIIQHVCFRCSPFTSLIDVGTFQLNIMYFISTTWSMRRIIGWE